MAILKVTPTEIIGAHGRLPLSAGDHAARKLALLIMTTCLGDAVVDAVAACGYTRARYYQVRRDYLRGGSDALRRRKPGRTHNTILTPAVEREVVRHLVLDPDATPRVVTQRMRQQGTQVSQRSVERTVTNCGLQKKRSPRIRARTLRATLPSTSAKTK